MNTENYMDQFKLEVHNPDWQKSDYFTISELQAKELWEWQEECFSHKDYEWMLPLCDQRFASIQAFCGSGKSFLQVCLAAYQIIKSNYTQKQLIVVPQEHQSDGFAKTKDYNYIKLKLPGDDKIFEWVIQPDHHFCEGKGRIRRLKKWLLTPPEKLGRNHDGTTITGLNAVCTSAALSHVWAMLSECEKKKAIEYLTLRIDEFHHASYIYDADDDIPPEILGEMQNEATMLGRIATYFLAGKTSGIHTTSATMFRGDRKMILSPESRKKFVEYSLDWIRHFNSLGIEHFYFSYEEYDKDPIKNIIQNIKEEINEKHLVVIPSSSTKWREFGHIELQKLLTELKKIYPENRILDLVTKRTQDKNKARLLAEPKTIDDGDSQFDVVVMCMLGREGTDWCPCSRVHNSSCESSITLAVQTIGRPFRRFAGKRVIKIKHYVRRFSRPSKKISKIDLLTDRTNAILVCMQLDDMSNPILIPVIPQQQGQGQGQQAAGKIIVNKKIPLAEVFGDQWQSAQKDLYNAYEVLEDRTEENIHELVNDILDQYNITENRENIRDGLELKLLKAVHPTARIKGIDISFLRKQGYGILSQQGSIYFRDLNKDEWKILREKLDSWMDNYNALKAFVGC